MDTELSMIINCSISGFKNVDDRCMRMWSPKRPLTIDDAIRLKISPSCGNCGHGTEVPFPTRATWERVKKTITKIANNEWDSITLAEIEESQSILCNALKCIKPIQEKEIIDDEN